MFLTLSKWRSYLALTRLPKPIGIWLLFWPGAWAILFASETLDAPTIILILKFLVGAVLMRSAGCIINDLTDKDIDGKVERTKDRPLASGEVSKKEAVTLLLILLLLSLGILLSLNYMTIQAGLLFSVLVVIYPRTKRFYKYPQVFLGITFGAGAIMGWLAAAPIVNYAMLMLYVASALWIFGYDTIYGHQDKKDDKAIGLHSSAISLGAKTKRVVNGCYAFTALLLVWVGLIQGLSEIYLGAITLAYLLLLWQINRVDLDNPESCMKAFKQNNWVGLIIFVSLLLERGA